VVLWGNSGVEAAISGFHFMRKFSAIVFDLDGTLTDSMGLHLTAWEHAFAKLTDISIRPEDTYEREGEKSIEFAEAMIAKYGNGARLSAQKIVDAYAAKLLEIFEVEFFPGAEDLVHELARNGKRLALVSGSKLVRENLKEYPAFLNGFTVIITGDDVQSGKPHPDPYLLAFERLGISASDALVIENAPFGIISARKAGASCWAVLNNSPLGKDELSRYGAERTFADLSELRTALFDALA